MKKISKRKTEREGRTMSKKHNPKFYVRYAQCKANVLDFVAPKGAIYGRFSDSKGNPVYWVCDYFKTDKYGNLSVYVNIDGEWSIRVARENSKIYNWVKYAVNKLGFIPVVDDKKVWNEKPSELMKTYSRHKKGTGSRINTNQINESLRWNEVTEIAHWYGKGNASVIANGIR